MKTATISNELESTETAILEYLETLYNIAVRLTGDEAEAEFLAYRTVMAALTMPTIYDRGPRLKGTLIALMRKTFLAEKTPRFARETADEDCPDFTPEYALSGGGFPEWAVAHSTCC